MESVCFMSLSLCVSSFHPGSKVVVHKSEKDNFVCSKSGDELIDVTHVPVTSFM